MSERSIKISPYMSKEFSILSILKDVEWTEPWIIILMMTHGFITFLTLVTRHHGNFQAGFFCILLLLVYFSETLNEIAAKNWKYFARHQYFDSSGLFISIVFSTPLLLNCLVMVGQWLWTSGNLMVKLKQAQLRKEIKEKELNKTSSIKDGDILKKNE
ncbi:transmembrane protein 18-like [Centruroides sculpturatus]|uniref:transmembrane protein 18-like n=1 Tax=Centruroides sculpturatus TaxID=218467 RepID=UPI000C6E51C5|nr:transmembrane protein 18-like [Centruroides sculpturatus]